MSNKKHNLPQRLVKGATRQSQEAKPPGGRSGGGGNIGRDLNIPWTPSKVVIAATLLGVPFLLATVMTFKSGNALVGLILVGIAIFVGLFYLALRYIEENEF